MTQVSLLPPPWELFTISEPSWRATRVSPPVVTYGCSPVSTNGRRSTWRGATTPSHKRRHRGQRQDGLGHVVARIGLDAAADLVLVRCGGVRSDEDAVAPRLVGRLHDQVVEVGEHVLALAVVQAHEGLDVGHERLLAEVVVDQGGNVGVEHLVVGHAGAGGVGDGHVAGPPRRHQPGHAERGVGAEHLGVEEQVVDPSVHHVHAHQAAHRAQVHDVVVDHEVAALRRGGRPSAGRGRRARSTPSCARPASAPRSPAPRRGGARGSRAVPVGGSGRRPRGGCRGRGRGRRTPAW